MRKKVFLLVLFGLCINSETFSQVSGNWTNSINSIEQLQSVYHRDAVHINVTGDVINGSEVISNFWVGQESR